MCSIQLNTEDLSLQAPWRVAFILQENFSMMAFTVAVDALVTANLLSSSELYNLSIMLDGPLGRRAGRSLNNLDTRTDDQATFV